MPPAWGRLSDLLPACRGFSASRGASSLVIISRLRLESWTVQPRVLLAAGRSGPRGHIILGRGCVRSGRSRRHRATSVPPGRAARKAPCTERSWGWASAGSGRDPGGDPKRSLGPAGRRWRAGCGGDHNLFRGNETVTVGRGSISQACPPSLTIVLVPGPTRTACSFTATVKAGRCQNSARAHTRGGKLFSKNESLD